MMCGGVVWVLCGLVWWCGMGEVIKVTPRQERSNRMTNESPQRNSEPNLANFYYYLHVHALAYQIKPHEELTNNSGKDLRERKPR